MLDPKVFIVLLNWNGWKDTQECVRSLEELDYSNFEIVIVDNCSTDNSVEILRSQFPELTVHEAGSNLGFAGGNNVGIRYALEQEADYVWLLNNDTLVEPGSLAPLVRSAACSRALTGSAIMRYPEVDVVWAAGGYVSPASAFTHHNYGECRSEALPDEPFAVDYLPGCSILVSREFIQRVGLMPEDYFLYFEDTAWCIEARRKGFERICVPQSRIYHKESQSTGYWSPKMRYFFVRGSVIFTRTYRSGRPLPTLWFYFRHHFANHILRLRLRALIPTIKGMIDGWARPIEARS